MTSLLEERYRRALRILPSSYRVRWEDDMVATFLDGAYAADPDDPEGVGLGSPTRSELVSIAALAIRLRLGGTEAPPRSFAWGEAARKVALVGLLAHAVVAVVGVGFNVWIAAHLPFVTIPPDAVLIEPDRWRALWMVAPLIWLAAYLLLLYGNWRAARATAWLALAGVVVANAVDLTSNGAPFTISRVCALAFDALPVLAMAAYHHTAPSVARGRWRWMLPAASVCLFMGVLVVQRLGGLDPFLDWAGMWCLGLLIAMVAWCRMPAGARLHWSVALATLGAATLLVRVTSLADYVAFAAPSASQSRVLVVDWAECGVLAIMSVVLIVYAVRGWRRLPEVAWSAARDGGES